MPRFSRACIHEPDTATTSHCLLRSSVAVTCKGICVADLLRENLFGNGRYETVGCGLAERGRDGSESFCLGEAQTLGVVKRADAFGERRYCTTIPLPCGGKGKVGWGFWCDTERSRDKNTVGKTKKPRVP